MRYVLICGELQMSDVFHVLKVDHEEIETVLRRLEVSRPPAGADPEWLLARRRLAERLIIEATKHEIVEEEFFWPAVREHVEDGDALADEATVQEQRAKSLLRELDGMGPGDERFEELLAEIVREARAHIAFEETRGGRRAHRVGGDGGVPAAPPCPRGYASRQTGHRTDEGQDARPDAPRP